jgi:hypothetical protein
MPNKANVKIDKMNLSLIILKGYEDLWLIFGSIRAKNKPNSKPIKPKTNPIAKRPEMNVTNCYTKKYRNKTAFRRNKNKPNSNPIFNPRCLLTCFGVYPRVCLPFVLPGVGGKPNNQSSIINNQLRVRLDSTVCEMRWWDVIHYLTVTLIEGNLLDAEAADMV